MDKSNRNWGDITKDLLETIIGYANSSAQQIIEEKKKEFWKKAIALIFISIGSIFLLIGLVQFINQIMIDGSWHGYIIVGSMITLVGIIFTKD